MKTFVVRLFVPLESEPCPGRALLHGLVEEVGSGRQATFAGGQQLLAFLTAAEAETQQADFSGRSRS